MAGASSSLSTPPSTTGVTNPATASHPPPDSASATSTAATASLSAASSHSVILTTTDSPGLRAPPRCDPLLCGRDDCHDRWPRSSSAGDRARRGERGGERERACGCSALARSDRDRGVCERSRLCPPNRRLAWNAALGARAGCVHPYAAFISSAVDRAGAVSGRRATASADPTGTGDRMRLCPRPRDEADRDSLRPPGMGVGWLPLMGLDSGRNRIDSRRPGVTARPWSSVSSTSGVVPWGRSLLRTALRSRAAVRSRSSCARWRSGTDVNAADANADTDVCRLCFVLDADPGRAGKEPYANRLGEPECL